MVFFHVFFSVFPIVSAFYESDSPVVKLTSENFSSLVIDSEDVWLVEFYAPWCGHCKKLAPEYEKAAKALKGFVKFGAVDMTTDYSAGGQYNIQGYPSLKFFSDDKKNPVDYDSGRTSKDLASFVLKQSQFLVNKRLGLKLDINEQIELEKKEKEKEIIIDESDIVVLDDATFEENVENSEEIWFVDFYAEWCSHCKRLAPDWAKAATALKNQIKFAKVDAIANTRLVEKYAVKSYPTLKVFLPEVNEPEEYKGGRDSDLIIKEAFNILNSIGKPPSVPQLISYKVLENFCANEICIIVFLPHIYDSSAAERNRFIRIIQESAKKNRAQPVKFLWTQAGDFPSLEKLVGISFGFPAVAGISLVKNRSALMTNAFNLDELQGFVRRLIKGKTALQEYEKFPDIETISPWDGKDHRLEPNSFDL